MKIQLQSVLACASFHVPVDWDTDTPLFEIGAIFSRVNLSNPEL